MGVTSLFGAALWLSARGSGQARWLGVDEVNIDAALDITRSVWIVLLLLFLVLSFLTST